MARTAPTDYASISTADTAPIEPIQESEWTSIAKNCNHAYRYLNPNVINQDMRERTTEVVKTNATSATLQAAYRVPVYGGAAGQTMGGTFWAFQSGAAGLFTGNVKVISTAGSVTVPVLSVGGSVAFAPYSFTGLALTTSGAPETITVEMWTVGITVNLYVSNFSAWLEPSGSPLAAGNDGEGWYPQDLTTYVADEPVPTYRVNRLSSNADHLATQRPGVALAWSADFFDLARSGVQVTAAEHVIERIPVRYGPKATTLKVYLTGFCNDGTKKVRVWTDQTGYSNAQTVSLPNAAAFAAAFPAAPSTGWVDVGVPLDPVASIGHTRLHIECDGSVANPMNLYGACAWESA